MFHADFSHATPSSSTVCRSRVNFLSIRPRAAARVQLPQTTSGRDNPRSTGDRYTLGVINSLSFVTENQRFARSRCAVAISSPFWNGRLVVSLAKITRTVRIIMKIQVNSQFDLLIHDPRMCRVARSIGCRSRRRQSLSLSESMILRLSNRSQTPSAGEKEN